MLLEKRKFALAVTYFLEIKSILSHPSYQAVTYVTSKRTFRNKPSVTPPFAMRFRTAAAVFNFEVDVLLRDIFLPIAPLLHTIVSCDFFLTKYNKKSVLPQVIQQNFLSYY